MFSGRFRSNKAQKKIRLKAENPNPNHNRVVADFFLNIGNGKTVKMGNRKNR
jgi:hypothetical protein